MTVVKETDKAKTTSVVVVIEKRALLASHEGVVFLALLFRHAAYQGAFVVVKGRLLAQPSWGTLAFAINRNRSIGGGGEALLLLPPTGTGSLEGLDDIAQAPLHGLKHFDNAVEMVWHTHARMDHHFIAMSL